MGKELKERQKQQLRQMAMKKGLDPEALTGKYPPKIRMYSKYERRTDTRTYEDRRKLYEGGWEVVRAEHLQASWKEKYDEWLKRPKSKLPKWFGERPGKKAGDPESPEGEEDDGGAAPAAEEFEEEEEEEEEEEDKRKKRKRRKRKKNKHSVIDHQDFQMAQILEEIRQQVFKITATQPTKLTSIFVYISKI